MKKFVCKSITCIVLVLSMTLAAPTAFASEEPEIPAEEIEEILVEDIAPDSVEAESVCEETPEVFSDTDDSLQEASFIEYEDNSSSEIICLDGSEEFDPTQYSSREDALSLYKAKMLARETQFSIKYYFEGEGGLSTSEKQALAKADANLFVTEGFVYDPSQPAAGDYLNFNMSSYSYKISGKIISDTYYMTLRFDISYLTDAAQEQAVDQKIDSILAGLNLEGKSDYRKLCAIYDYITKNVKYDYTQQSDLTFTAYSAIINKAAVCQGIASLFYRMALEAGLSVRMIPGDCDEGGHMWVIVALGNKWYNLDPTWDLGYKAEKYEYFLKCNNNFTNHYPDYEYTTSAFEASHPISEFDFTQMGDANGDGEITASDLISLMNILGSGAESIAEYTADADESGTVDMLDLVWIMKYLSTKM